jgi:hypothetical protein
MNFSDGRAMRGSRRRPPLSIAALVVIAVVREAYTRPTLRETLREF